MVAQSALLLRDVIRHEATPLAGANDDYDPLLQMIGDARLVLIGEALRGTHEFYRERAQITKRLIQERGFTAVAVEADWPDAYRVNQYVRGRSSDEDAGLRTTSPAILTRPEPSPFFPPAGSSSQATGGTR